MLHKFNSDNEYFLSIVMITCNDLATVGIVIGISVAVSCFVNIEIPMLKKKKKIL